MKNWKQYNDLQNEGAEGYNHRTGGGYGYKTCPTFTKKPVAPALSGRDILAGKILQTRKWLDERRALNLTDFSALSGIRIQETYLAKLEAELATL